MPFTNLGYAQGAGYRGDENNFGDNASREDLRKLGEIGMKEYEYREVLQNIHKKDQQLPETKFFT